MIEAISGLGVRIIDWASAGAGVLALPHTWNKIAVSVSNAQLLIGSLTVAAVMWGLLRRESIRTDPDARALVLGIFLSALGFGLHRLFWFLAVLAASPDEAYGATFEAAKWITLVLAQIVTVGYGLHTRMYFRARLASCVHCWWVSFVALQAGAVALGVTMYLA